MLALLDGDIIVYRIGFTTENDSSEVACWRAQETVEKILSDVGATEYKVYLTTEGDPTAFRPTVYPEYKANRKAPKPKWYHAIRDFLQVQWGAEVVKYLEADDALGITQMQHNDPDIDNMGCLESVICSIDKDLKQIPGHHYNFVKEEKSFVTDSGGRYYFYKQLLTGDSADNIKGVSGVGEKTAEKILAGKNTEEDLFQAVRETYQNDGEMLMNGRVLWIWKKPDDDWRQYWERLSEVSD